MNLNKIRSKQLLRKIAHGLFLYLNPAFHFRFSKEAYLNSNTRPYGWWRMFPKIHFCVFNRTQGAFSDKGMILRMKSKSARPAVLFVSHELTRTGAPILLLNLMNSFSGKYDIALVSLEGGELIGDFSKIASWIEVPGEMCGNRKKFVDQSIERISRTLDVKFAIVNTIVCSKALLKLRTLRIPSIHLIHEFIMGRENLWGLKLSSLYANATVFSSRLVMDNAVSKATNIQNSKTHVIPQGIFDPSFESRDQESENSVAKFTPTLFKQPGEILVLGAGTINYRKGVDLFLDCAKKSMGKNPSRKIKFVWIGQGFRKNIKPYAMFLMDQIEKYGLGGRFEVVDEVSDFKKACIQADIFFLSSRLDPLPIVAQTALRCGIPVVCFEKGAGTAEFLLKDEKAAFGVTPYLDTDVASERIVELASSEKFRAEIGGACRRVAETCFDASDYIRKLEDLVEASAVENALHEKDAVVIRQSGLLDQKFVRGALQKSKSGLINGYLLAWRRGGSGMRKPFPGFHPGIFQEDTMGSRWAGDPFANFIWEGMPPGRWTSPVLSPGSPPEAVPSSVKSALHLHLYYPRSAAAIIARASRSSHRPDLYISVPSPEAAREVAGVFEKHPGWKHMIRVVPNRGRDVAPFLTEFAPELKNYDIIGHVHAKETTHVRDRGIVECWNTFLLENVIGGRHAMIDFIVSAMLRDETLGIVFPDDPNVIGWTKNREFADDLARRMRFRAPLPESINFPVGTMFWARTEALKPLFDLNLGWEDYPEEPLPVDGSILHAVERLLPLVVNESGYRQALTHIPGISR